MRSESIASPALLYPVGERDSECENKVVEHETVVLGRSEREGGSVSYLTERERGGGVSFISPLLFEHWLE